MKATEVDDIDPELLAATEQAISIAGWPSRDRAPAWLARILTEAATAAVEQAMSAEREECAKIADDVATNPGPLACEAIAIRIRARGEG